MCGCYKDRNDKVKVQDVTKLRVIISAFEVLSRMTSMDEVTHDLRLEDQVLVPSG